MEEQLEQIPVSGELLALMRNAAAIAQRLHEPFITNRALLLALLEDPKIGPGLNAVIPRERLEAAQPEADMTPLIASRRQEPGLPAGERPAILRFDTLAFKTPDGSTTVWLSREAFKAFTEGAKRVGEGVYLPEFLAFGIAAEATRTPGILAALHISPGAINDVVKTPQPS